MSYCVNCGVELDKAEVKCPLCGVEVINPAVKEDEEACKKYPQKVETPDSLSGRRFWVKIVSILLSVPTLICLTSNLLYDGSVSWSLYPIGGIAVLWAIVVSPFLFKKPSAIKWIIIDIIAVSGYLYLLEYLTASGRWFLPVALPIVLCLGLFVLAFTVLLKKRLLRGLYIVSTVLFSLGLILIGVEITIDLYLEQTAQIVWSWFVLITCLALAFTFIIIERKKKLKEELRKRLHI